MTLMYQSCTVHDYIVSLGSERECSRIFENIGFKFAYNISFNFYVQHACKILLLLIFGKTKTKTKTILVNLSSMHWLAIGNWS